MGKQVIITRESAELSNFGERVFVTGPHFGKGFGHGHSGAVFSSTTDPAQASRYSEKKAAAIVSIHGSWTAPKIEET